MHSTYLHCPIPFALALCMSISQPLCFSQASNGLSSKLVQVQKRAEAGHIRDQKQLAEAYMTGKGAPQDPAIAAHWYEQAAKLGDPAAQHQVGYLYSAGLGVPRDPVRAFHWYQLAASSGDTRARVNMGAMYLNGRGVPKDPVRAREMFRQAAQEGEGIAAAYLGILEFLGVGGPIDLEAAKKDFEHGVKLHDPVAAFELAVFYTKHDTHPHDPLEIAGLLRRSSDKGYVSAKYQLGVMLMNNPQLAQSDDDPIKLLEDASDAGDWRASIALGDSAVSGYRSTKDNVRAFYLYTIAVSEGGNPARQVVQPKLDSLTRSLSPEQQAQASQQAKTWLEQHHAPLMFVLNANGSIPTFKDLSVPLNPPPPK